MTIPHIFVTKCKVKEKCSLCDTFIEKNEKCLIIYSYKNENVGFHNIKIHIKCIDSFFKEIKLIVKEAILKELK